MKAQEGEEGEQRHREAMARAGRVPLALPHGRWSSVLLLIPLVPRRSWSVRYGQ
uniref:Uncharacterized protein n=1 Tax=Triticum urartu TaxID=4572 RepID=A0A8R7QGI2_TRIUA